MPTFVRADKSVETMAGEILAKYYTHKPLLDLKVSVDYVMAHANQDENGMPIGDALKHHGVRALGIAKILPLKRRVMGSGDCEVSLDGDWWNEASDAQRVAVLDHELHHFSLNLDKIGKPTYDDIGRPQLRMRKHDFDFGWFNIIAVRHSLNSQECLQAKSLMDGAGQFYWPQLTGKKKPELKA